MKLMNSIIILLLSMLLYAPISSYGSSRLKENFFDGKLYLSNSPVVGQKAIITLDLTDVLDNCGATTIVFRMPDGVLISGQSVFRETSFIKGLSRQYSTEVSVLKEGIYALQASVYFDITKNGREAEHFFLYLIVNNSGSRISDNIDHLTKSENGIDVRILTLAPPEPARAMSALSIQGQVTYYDDNLTRPIPIRKVMVQLFEINQNGSELLGTTYTDNDGFYTFDDINAPKLGDGNTRNLQPKLVFDNDVIKIIDDANSAIYTFDLPLIPNASVGSIVSNYFLNETNQQRAIGNIFNNAVTAYDFLQEKVNWKRNKLSLTWPYQQAERASYYYKYSSSSGKLASETIRIPIKSQWDQTTFFHEYGHSVMMALYGYNNSNIPQSNYVGTHSATTVSDAGFAMDEGWAEFFEALIHDNAFNFTQFANANTPNIEYNSWWKGKDGNNTNGEIVEGSVASIFWDIVDTAQSIDEVPNADDDDINNMIVELWDLMAKNRPLSIITFWDFWQNNNYGQVESLYKIFTNNGVNVTIKPQNHPPVADSKTVETDEDTSLSIKLTGIDPDNNPLTYAIGEQPKNGTLSGNVPDVIYTPKSEFNGADSFTFLVNDGSVNSAPATVSITIKSVNDPPVAKSQAVSTQEDTPITITLVGSDIDNTDITYKVTSNPTKGILEGKAPELKYTPNPDFFGDDSFDFTVSDGFIESNSTTVKITVSSINDPPTANPQSVVTDEDNAIDILLAGADVESDPLTFKITKNPVNGSTSGNPPNVKYKPNPDFSGTDSFTFVANDGKADSQTATITITINEINDPPTVKAVSVKTEEDTPVKITLTGSDPEGENLTFRVTQQPSHGALAGTPPELTYTPQPNFNGNDSFTFVASDGKADGGTETVSIAVNTSNDPPVASPQSITTDEDTIVKITLTGIDPDSDKLSFKVIKNPLNGVLSGTPPDVTYTPNPNFNGDDGFSFSVNDGVIDSKAENVSIKVNPVNDIPVADAQSASTDENIPVNIRLSGSDPDGNNITFKITIQTTNGKLSGTPPDLAYEPKYGFIGEDSFTFVTDDGVTTSVPVKVGIKVNSTGDPLDVNKDGIINILDIVIIGKFFGKSDFPIDHNPDVNRDGSVDSKDLEIVISNFGKKSAS